MSTLADFHGIGPLANRPAAATAHALRGGVSKIAMTWTDSATNTLYGLNLAGNAWVAIGSGGDGGTPLAIENEGAQILAAASRINFAGAGVTVTDAGGGEATVTIPGTSEAEQLTVTTLVPPNINAGSAKNGVVYDTPNRDEGGAPSSVRFGLGFSYNPYAANSQGAGQPLYTNNTFGIGWNLNAAYSLIDSTKGGPSFRIEHRFKVLTKNPSNVGGWTDGSEFHQSMRTTNDTEYRPMTIYAPYTNAAWAWDSSIGFTSADYGFFDGNKTLHMQFAWGGSSSADKPIFLTAPVRVHHAGNNLGFMLQRNAADSAYLPLPFLNAQDYVQSEQPIYVVSAAVNSPLGRKTLLTLQGTTGWIDGSRAVDVEIASPVAGWMTGYSASAEAATRLEGFYLENTHASGHCGGRIVANGNTYLDFYRTTGDKKWGMGLRSDDTFAIGQQDNGVAISDAIRINYTTLQTTFMQAPKLPSATVAGVGSASAAGAGALHYVIDLNATTVGSTAAGGGSNKGVVVSDGTDWRIMAAW